MANLPIKFGKGILSIYPNNYKFNFLDKLGIPIYVNSEDDMDKFCALIGAGSGFCYKIFETY